LAHVAEQRGNVTLNRLSECRLRSYNSLDLLDVLGAALGDFGLSLPRDALLKLPDALFGVVALRV